MKKLIMFMIVALFLVGGSVFAVTEEAEDNSASASGVLTVFEGLVMFNGVPAADHEVIIMCEHDYKGKIKTKVVKTTSTDANGHYLATIFNKLPARQCVVGDTAFIIVKDGNDRVISEDSLVVEEKFREASFGYASMSVGVPEFSVATMAAAVVGVTLGIVALRRKE